MTPIKRTRGQAARTAAATKGRGTVRGGARETVEALTRRHAEELAEKTRLIEGLRLKLENAELQIHDLLQQQADIEAERDRYVRLYDGSPVSFMVIDRIGRVSDLNAAAAAMLGVDRSRAIGRPLVEYVHRESRNTLFSHLHACRTGSDEVVTTGIRMRTSRDEVLVAELISHRAYTDRAHVLAHTAILDITERVHADQSLRESESKSRGLTEKMPVVAWTIDCNRRARHISASIAALLGYNEIEMHVPDPRFWMDNVHPDDRARLERAYRRLFDAPLRSAGAGFEMEYRRLTKDGRWMWVLDKVISVSEEDGRRRTASGVFWDITARKRTEAELRESEQRFRQLAENISEVFYLVDVQSNRIVYVSPAFEKVWGFPGQTLYWDQSSWQRSIHPDHREAVNRAFDAGAGGEPYDAEFRIVRPDGKLRWIRSRGFPIRDAEGRLHRVAGIAEDVTDRHEAATALQASHDRLRDFGSHLEAAREEERTRIAREVHDELGAALLSLKIDLDACRRELPAGAFAAAKGMQALMDRVDATIGTVRRIATDLRPSVLDHVGVLAAVEWQADDVERRTGIICEVAVEPPQEELDLDAERATALFRIVQEALNNAVRHSQATAVRIALRRAAGHVELRIEDNGRGFDPRTPKAHKWGLIGMEERAKALGGEFGIRSAPGAGTAISVAMPLPVREKASNESQKADSRALGMPQKERHNAL